MRQRQRSTPQTRTPLFVGPWSALYVCVCVCACVCVCVCIVYHIYVYTHVCTHTCVHTHMCVHIYRWRHMSVCTYLYIKKEIFSKNLFFEIKKKRFSLYTVYIDEDTWVCVHIYVYTHSRRERKQVRPSAAKCGTECERSDSGVFIGIIYTYVVYIY